MEIFFRGCLNQNSNKKMKDTGMFGMTKCTEFDRLFIFDQINFQTELKHDI